MRGTPVSQSHSSRFGIDVPPGIRLDGVPGPDKDAAWHRKSDCSWDVVWVTALKIQESILPSCFYLMFWENEANEHKREVHTECLALKPTKAKTKQRFSKTSAVLSCLIRWKSGSLSKVDYTPRYKIRISSGRGWRNTQRVTQIHKKVSQSFHYRG